MNDRRLIEVNLPLYEISRLSAKQKQGVRTGQIKALHIWWARRPTAASRAAVLATLLAAPKNDKKREELEKFVASACTWDASLDRKVIGKARDLIAEHFNGQAPRVLDPFSGGGIIPLEALRLGCETHAVELNPVAYLVNLCTLVYPQQYGSDTRKVLTPEDLLHSVSKGSKSRLAADVEHWGDWVLEQARAEVGKFYDNPVSNDAIVAYLWARTVECPNPSCGATIPLIMQFWLRRRPGKEEVALKPVVDRQRNMVTFEIIRGEEIEKTDFNPSEGTTSQGSATCVVCGQTVEVEYVRREGRGGRIGKVPLAVVTTPGYGEGKDYRPFARGDLANFTAARERLEQLEEMHNGRLSPVPDEPLPSVDTLGFRVQRYGITKWGQLFNSRQALMLATFASKVQEANQMVLAETGDEDYARAVTTYLGLLVDRLADYGSTLCAWDNTTQTSRHTFTRQALPMVWDYAEANVFREPSGPWAGALGRVVDIIDYCAQSSNQAAHVRQGTSTSLPYPDGHFEAVVTDPPYYDAVPYADISDFFYVWLKRSVGELYPQVFRSPLTPKSSEIIQETSRHGDQAAAKRFYEREMTKAFSEARRVLQPSGRCAVMFAHKTTSAWETLITSLLEAGLVTTASWPLHTEQATRLRARGSAALASSILLVCKKRDLDAGVGYYDQVSSDLEERIHERLDFFWEQGIRGSDFFIAAIGPALGVFGQHAEVRRLSGESVTVSEFLNEVRSIVTDYALVQVLHNGHVGAVDPATRFYVIWRWAYGSNEVPFDDGRVLAQALGAEIDDLMQRTNLLRGRKNLRLWKIKARVKRDEELGEPEGGIAAPLVDVLQRACVLWEQEERVALSEFLNRALMGRDEIFWSVAQSLSEILPDGDKEKQLLQGLLVSHDRLPELAKQERLL